MNNPDKVFEIDTNVRSEAAEVLANIENDLRLLLEVMVHEGMNYYAIDGLLKENLYDIFIRGNTQTKAAELAGVQRGTFSKWRRKVEPTGEAGTDEGQADSESVVDMSGPGCGDGFGSSSH